MTSMSAKGWKCCGCGRVSPDGNKPCDCVTICAYHADEKGSKVWDDCSMYDNGSDAETIASLRDHIASLEAERDTQREHIRKQAEDIMTLGKLVYATEDETWQARAARALDRGEG